MKILLDIDGTIASWASVMAHGFGPGHRPFDQRALELVNHHEVTLFSQNPHLAEWAAKLGCGYLRKPPPGKEFLALTGYDVLIDDEAELFAGNCPGIQTFLSVDDFLASHPL